MVSLEVASGFQGGWDVEAVSEVRMVAACWARIERCS